MAIVPDVSGLSGQEALLRLARAGLIGGLVGSQISETVPRGLVLHSSPVAGEEVPDCSHVFLVDSMGPLPSDVVPDLVDVPLETARETLRAAGYLAIEHPRSDPEIEPGRVTGSLPPAGTTLPAHPGVAVSVFVSTGREPFHPDQPDPARLRAELAAGPAAAGGRTEAVARLRVSTAGQQHRIEALQRLIEALAGVPRPDTSLIDQLDADLRRLRGRLDADRAGLAELDGA